MFRGAIVALATPFKDNYDLDLEAYGRLIDFQLENGIDGIVPCGCTGEAATLSHEEQETIIKFAVDRVAGRVPVIAGTGSNNTSEALRLTQYAKDVGATAALLITPYYNKPGPAGQVAHYRLIAEETGLPIMLYNVPGRTGTKMSPETIAELSKTENIVSVKEACGSVDQVSQILNLCDINVVSGDDSLTVPMMSVGATGVVSVAANVVPQQCADMCESFLNGDLETARNIHYIMLNLFGGLFVETNPVPVKAALAKMGLCTSTVRLPLTKATAETEATVEALLKAVDVLT